MGNYWWIVLIVIGALIILSLIIFLAIKWHKNKIKKEKALRQALEEMFADEEAIYKELRK